ncbi:hypothetical protein BS78_06G287800 [Paspalum vaginatum]|nr:hypothetical protein BS78_06G287800 [Paspalum vaginatum]
MLKTTPLEREVSLTIDMRIMAEYFERFKGMGLYKWEAYKENRANRRLKYGLFFVVPHPRRLTTIVLSHAKHMPLKQARKRSRIELEKRRRILEKYNNNSQGPLIHVSTSVTRLVLYTLLSMLLGCVIVMC